jgi:hypothetical protein
MIAAKLSAFISLHFLAFSSNCSINLSITVLCAMSYIHSHIFSSGTRTSGTRTTFSKTFSESKQTWKRYVYHFLHAFLKLDKIGCVFRKICLPETHFLSLSLCVAGKTGGDKSVRSALDAPRDTDKSAADADDERNAAREEEDAAVQAVEGEPAPLGSRSPTPPPASQAKATLADHLAKLVATGAEIPGFASEDELVAGESSRDNVVAAAAGEKRAGEKRKKAVEPDATESDENAVPKAARRDSRKSGTVQSKRRAVPVPEPKRPRDTITVEDSDEEHERKSRHKSVEGSKIYKDWEGPLLAEVRRRFTTLIAVRDGYPLRFGVTFREMNYKLALQAARDVMPKAQFTAFRTQMEAAFKDPSKE